MFYASFCCMLHSSHVYSTVDDTRVALSCFILWWCWWINRSLSLEVSLRGLAQTSRFRGRLINHALSIFRTCKWLQTFQRNMFYTGAPMHWASLSAMAR